MEKKRYHYFCEECGKQYWASRANAKYCSTTCYNTQNNRKSRRISTRLTNEQRDVIFALHDYFLEGRAEHYGTKKRLPK